MSRKSLMNDFTKHYKSDKYKVEISHYAEPNLLGMIAIVVVTANSQKQAHDRWGVDHGGTIAYIVCEDLHYGDCDACSDPSDTTYDDRVEAERHYNKLLAELQDTPNWAAQEDYDREHGTVNGYDPKILEWQELVGEEAGY